MSKNIPIEIVKVKEHKKKRAEKYVEIPIRQMGSDNENNSNMVHLDPNEQKTPSRKRESVSPPMTQRISRPNQIPHSMYADDPKQQKKYALRLSKLRVPKRVERKPKMSLFSHLIQMEHDINMGESVSLGNSPIHPCFISFGLQASKNLIFFPHSRAVRLIYCLKTFIDDYISPIPDEFSKDFESSLRPSLSFLNECRQNSSGMATVIKLFKDKFNETHGMTESEMKNKLHTFLDEFLNERIFLAGDVISGLICQRLSQNDDTVLVCSYSEIILRGLKLGWKDNKNFKVIIVDYPPRFDGLKMLKGLDELGIPCSYVHLNALAFVMSKVTKIFLSATSLLSNGAVMAPVGTALIATVAFSANVPVLVCCESYNFTERAQTDAFVYNELGDPDDMINPKLRHSEVIKDWKNNPRITLANLYYDVIQPKFITAIVTELGIIPCSSAPVVFRVKN